MNFDNIKAAMDADADQKDNIKIDLGKGPHNPVALIRRNMRIEILTQLIGVIIFLIAPFTFLSLDPKPQAIYLIFIFIISVMILLYTLKLSLFLREVDPMTNSTTKLLQQFIYKAKLTLQVYKSFMLASTLLIPVAVFALITGNINGQYHNPTLFEKWIYLAISGTELSLLIIGYLLLAGAFYYMTISWTKTMYGKHLTALEILLNNLEEEE
ncbi:hypothetical protein DNU06_13395 [Putridiphycobacter roseus]|uniref:Uncharacterized protein n=1 Tax=Putridiphycobacter roseus TaxID=2219161 RepID=A0A2W1NB66_9FLAO|nr:hypothetical protein [Putridiphycobacter roseus]PZE16303.1 hypothetical protein DNU06_13395 [Putridiphycobacter roseus]